MSGNTLENYYQVIFSLVQHHKWSISEIENLVPFERDIYVTMTVNYIKEVESQHE